MYKSLVTAAALFGAITTAAPKRGSIVSRNILTGLPQNASPLEIKFQPWTDYDNDGCYSTAAVDEDGTTNEGGHATGTLQGACRDLEQLENDNVYSRSRCNNGICAVMYEYYFEKDQLVAGTIGVGPANGHVHDWENVVVFSRGDEVIHVATSCHGKYGGGMPELGGSPDNTHPYVVYHKDGAGTHCWRLADWSNDIEDEDGNNLAENPTGDFVSSRLVGWNGWPEDNVAWDALVEKWPSGVSPKIYDDTFAEYLRKAAGDNVPGFDPEIDE